MKRVSIAMTLLFCALVMTAAGEPGDLMEGLIFYVPFDSSTDAVLAGGQKEPSHNKGTSLVEGKFGKGVDLTEGKETRLYYPGEGNFNISEGTIAFWVKRKEKWSSGKGFIFFKAQVQDWNKSSLYLTFTKWNEIRAWIWSDEGKSSNMLTPNNPPYGADTWYHVALTFADGNVNLYINGEKLDFKVNAACDPMMVMPTGTPKYIQFGSSYTGSEINGVMDELRIFKRVLSAEEVKKLHAFVPKQ